MSSITVLGWEWHVIFNMVPVALAFVGHAGAHVLAHCTYRPVGITAFAVQKDTPAMVLGGSEG